jgi:hypothetical protein
MSIQLAESETQILKCFPILDLLQKSINRKFYLRLSVFICGLYSIQLFMQEVYCFNYDRISNKRIF